MEEHTYVILDATGIVVEVDDKMPRLCGIARDDLIGYSLTARMIPEHHVRFEAEIEALVNEEETRGRLHCTLIGLDGIGRRMTMAMHRTAEDTAGDRIHVAMSRYSHPESVRRSPGSSLVDQGRLLPVTRRIAGIAKHATDRTDLLTRALGVFAEIMSAEAAAVLEWEHKPGKKPIATLGSFDESYLETIYRSAILTRLTRGDVVIKDSHIEGDPLPLDAPGPVEEQPPGSMILIPLLSAVAPLGIIALLVRGYFVLVPEEQQSLVILGEITALGLEPLQSRAEPKDSRERHPGDSEATVTLGRFSAGLAHEINNAATVLGNTIEQLTLHRDGFGRGILTRDAVKDSLSAIEAVRHLTDALRAFAPEETKGLEEVNIFRILDIVVRTLRFYAKEGIDVTIEPPAARIPKVMVHSHFLIRSLFLLFVELVEASASSGRRLDAHLILSHDQGVVTLIIEVAVGPFNMPSVLLAQLEPGGALARHLARAGAGLSHDMDLNGNLSITIPMSEVTDKPRPARDEYASAPPRRGTILIADDDAAIIRSLRRVLERYHDVLAAESGEEALSIIDANPYLDLVVYDASMPRCTGPEFFEELKKHNLSMASRIIFASGGAPDSRIAHFLRDTSNPVVEKPFDLQRLNDLIASMVV